MAEEIHESVLKADRWSKIIGMFSALGVYLGVLVATNEPLFSMIVAAFAAIGIRIYIPYYASRLYTPGTNNLQNHEVAGDYHHGAAALALLFGCMAAVAMQLTEPNTSVSLAFGIAVGVLSFFVLRNIIPTA